MENLIYIWFNIITAEDIVITKKKKLVYLSLKNIIRNNVTIASGPERKNELKTNHRHVIISNIASKHVNRSLIVSFTNLSGLIILNNE